MTDVFFLWFSFEQKIKQKNAKSVWSTLQTDKPEKCFSLYFQFSIDGCLRLQWLMSLANSDLIMTRCLILLALSEINLNSLNDYNSGVTVFTSGCDNLEWEYFLS